jgi:UDP-3-O-[3-hydroxymyristoyl] glucosamine N-acyltransferase
MIANGVKLDNLVHVGHNCQIGEHSVIAAQAGLSGSCTFGKNVVVGGQAGFGERCKLEDGAIIGGQAGVLGGKTIRTGETVWGTPARSLEKFKGQFAWQARLPELAARIKNLESHVRK